MDKFAALFSYMGNSNLASNANGIPYDNAAHKSPLGVGNQKLTAWRSHAANPGLFTQPLADSIPSHMKPDSPTRYGNNQLLHSDPAHLRLRLHAFLPRSRANGPGWRAVVWTQGCSLRCPGCFNPATHDPAGGRLVSVTVLLRRIWRLGNSIEGVTVSGGEPLEQAEAVVALLEELRRSSRLSVLVFTGYTWEELLARPDAARWLGCVDVVIADRYDARQHLARGLCGSANKTVHLLTDRYSLADLEAVPEAQVVLNPTVPCA